MKVRFAQPFEVLSGHLPDFSVTTFVRGRKVFARGHTKPKNPRTPDQLATRAFQTAANLHLRTVTPTQFAAWDAYARKHYRGTGLTGYLLFLRVQFLRQCMGLPLSADAPRVAPPPAAVAITQVGKGNGSGCPSQLPPCARRPPDAVLGCPPQGVSKVRAMRQQSMSNARQGIRETSPRP
jgi:hypothetical protein